MKLKLSTAGLGFRVTQPGMSWGPIVMVMERIIEILARMRILQVVLYWCHAGSYFHEFPC